MSDPDAILATILGAGLTDPDAIRKARAEDTPRLVYADWLQEHGQPERAEFIRVQVELARLVDELQSDEVCGQPGCLCGRMAELCRRESELLIGSPTSWGANGWFGDWVSSIHPNHDLNGFRWSFSRGFVSRLTCSWSDWRDHAERIIAEHPIERVTLTTLPELDGEDGRWEVRIQTKARTIAAGVDVAYHEMATTRWPAIVFEFDLPRTAGEAVLVEWERRILRGDPNAPRPLGIINANEERGPRHSALPRVDYA